MVSTRNVRFSASPRSLLVLAVVLALAVCAALIVPQQASAALATGGISGKVVEFNGDPGSYADVWLYTVDAFGPANPIAFKTADELGRYAFSAVPDGDYYVEDLSTYNGVYVTVAGGTPAVAPDIVRPEPGAPAESISGTVVDPALTGIPGVWVAAYEAEPMVGYYAWVAGDYTNLAGQYSIPLDSGGFSRFYNVQFTRDGYFGGGDGFWQQNNAPLVVADDALVTDIAVLANQHVTGINAEMAKLPRATVRGILLDDSASPVGGVNPAQIAIYDDLGTEIAFGTADAVSGEFSVTFEIPDTVSSVYVRFVAEGYADGFYSGDGKNVIDADRYRLPGGAVAIPVAADSAVSISPVMPYVGFGTVNLTVTDDLLQHVGGATAEFWKIGGDGYTTIDEPPAVFNGDGLGAINCLLEPGSYKVQVAAFGWKDLWIGDPATGATPYVEAARIVQVVKSGSLAIGVELPYIGYSTISGTLRTKTGAALTALPDLNMGTWFNLTRYDQDLGTFEWVDFRGEFDSATGQYTTDEVDPGTGLPHWTIEAGEYHVGAGSDGYLDGYYGPSGTTVFDEAAAQSVFAADGVKAAGIDIKMSKGGTLTGTVKSATGALLANIKVTAVKFDPVSGSFDTWNTRYAFTSASGAYKFAPVAATAVDPAMPGLVPGEYALFFEDETGAYLSELYSDVRARDIIALDETTTAARVTRLNVPDGTVTVPLVTLGAAGRISGTISYGDSTWPAAKWVEIFRYDSFLGTWVSVHHESMDDARAAGSSAYTLGNFEAGTYRVELGDEWSSEFYNGASGTSTVTGALSVAVPAGGTASGVNAVLVKPAEVTVEVLDPSGYPIGSNAEITFFENVGTVEAPAWRDAHWALVDPISGVCTTKILPGTYRVQASYPGLASRFWDGLGSTPSIFDATDLILAEGASGGPTYQIQVADGGVLAGSVVRDADASVVSGVDVDVYDASTEKWLASTQTRADGTFELSGMNIGQYKVALSADNKDLVSEFYNDAPSPGAAATITFTSAGRVDLGVVGLASAQHISGTVRDTLGRPILGAAVAVVPVQAWADGSTDMRTVSPVYTSADGAGAYSASCAPGVDHRLEAFAEGYATSVYQGSPVVPALGVGGGTLLQPYTPVRAGDTANFALAARVASLTGRVQGPGGVALSHVLKMRLEYLFSGGGVVPSGWIEVGSTSSAPNGAYQFDVTDLLAGRYRVQFIDPFGIYTPTVTPEFTLSSRQNKVLVDSGAPTTTVTAPAGWQRTPAKVSFSATDTVVSGQEPWGAAYTEYALGTGSWTRYSGQFEIAQSGLTSVRYRSVDLFGNREATRTATVMVDRVAPVTSSDATSVILSNRSIKLTPSDAHSGVLVTKWSLDGGPVTSGASVPAVSAIGPHKLEFWSQDVAGNIESVNTVTFSVVPVPSTNPVVTSAKFSNPIAYQLKSLLTTRFSCNVDVSGATGKLQILNGNGVIVKTIYNGALAAGANTLPAWNGLDANGKRLFTAAWTWRLTVTKNGKSTVITGKIPVSKIYFSMTGTATSLQSQIKYMMPGNANIYIQASTARATDRLSISCYEPSGRRVGTLSYPMTSAKPLSATAYFKLVTVVRERGNHTWKIGASNTVYSILVIQ